MRRHRTALVAATLMVAALSAAPSRAAGGLAGAGIATAFGCTGPFTITGANDSGMNWSFAVSYAGAGSSLCFAGGVPVASGVWSPATGLPCLTGGAGSICVGPVTLTGTPTTTSVSFCIPLSTCFSGTATVVRG